MILSPPIYPYSPTPKLTMSKSPKSSSSIVPILVTVGLLLGGAAYFGVIKVGNMTTPSPTISSTNGNSPDPTLAANFPAPSSVPANTQVRIDGATSMVTINKNLKTAIEKQYPGVQILTQSNGSEPGLKALQAGTIDLAAVSRPLTPQEAASGLESVPMSRDPIAVVVGSTNPVGDTLTSAQIADIFSGKITDWSQVGGQGKIRIINRAAASGTRQVFQDLFLKGATFGTGANVNTLTQDATTPLLRALGADGIGYATYYQVAAQTTVRVLSVDGISPSKPEYPYQRSFLYVYKTPPNPAVKAFLGYALSPEGQQASKSEQ
jgi:phosphate transport system substrate-binding protein